MTDYLLSDYSMIDYSSDWLLKTIITNMAFSVPKHYIKTVLVSCNIKVVNFLLLYPFTGVYHNALYLIKLVN